ncbi:MAG: DUF4301 family protein [Bacteroidales bacterium]
MLNINEQLNNFKQGFPFLNIVNAATPAQGIKILTNREQNNATNIANSYVGEICKFVPASGAATRMFKDLFEAVAIINKGGKIQEDSPAYKFISNISRFPFFSAARFKSFNAEEILKFTLFSPGLNYGAKPKGLIEFHKYENENRTAFEEHLVEGALYARQKDETVKIVITVSEEHIDGFKSLFNLVQEKYEKRFSCKYDITFDTQSHSTDIVAVDMENNPFKKENGEILFRPGGHGALLENLNKINSNVIIIKNIDNVVKESLIDETIKWKKILTGQVISLQNKIFEYINKLDNYSTKVVPDSFITEITTFLSDEFCIDFPFMSKDNLIVELKNKLNRPIRVCGMVKNEGEPGGGPFVIMAPDGSTSLQILEGAQIDVSNPLSAKAVKNATHFNPVDLVCAVKNYKGGKFNLSYYSDLLTGFISSKTFEGRPLKAQELPGLWNGAMSNWNTQFVEVPLITFNPVKSVLDLLREQHC